MPQHCQLLLRVDAGLDLPELVHLLSHYAVRAVRVCCARASRAPPLAPPELHSCFSPDDLIDHSCDASPKDAWYDLQQLLSSLRMVLRNSSAQDAAGVLPTAATSDNVADSDATCQWWKQARALLCWLDSVVHECRNCAWVRIRFVFFNEESVVAPKQAAAVVKATVSVEFIVENFRSTRRSQHREAPLKDLGASCSKLTQL